MKSILIASFVGSIAAAITTPAVQNTQEIRKPFSWHGPINTQMPRLPLDLVLTDVVVNGGSGYQSVTVDVNGQVVAALQTRIDASLIVSWNQVTYYSIVPLQLASGIPIPAGSTLTVLGGSGSVTLSGYTH